MNVNAPFEGSLFVGERGRGWILDLTAGDFERIPGGRWEEALDGRAYRYAGSFHAEARLSPSGACIAVVPRIRK